MTVVSCGLSDQSDELLSEALITVVGLESLSLLHSRASATDESWPLMGSRRPVLLICLRSSLPTKNCLVAVGRGSALNFHIMGLTRVPHLCSHLSQEASQVIVLTSR